jgi:hypothetical protein
VGNDRHPSIAMGRRHVHPTSLPANSAYRMTSAPAAHAGPDQMRAKHIVSDLITARIEGSCTAPPAQACSPSPHRYAPPTDRAGVLGRRKRGGRLLELPASRRLGDLSLRSVPGAR